MDVTTFMELNGNTLWADDAETGEYEIRSMQRVRGEIDQEPHPPEKKTWKEALVAGTGKIAHSDSYYKRKRRAGLL